MKHEHSRYIATLLVVVGILWAVGVACSPQKGIGSWLQPTISVETRTRRLDQPVDPDEQDLEIEDDVLQEHQEDESVLEGPQPICDGPESMSVLVLGLDRHAQSDAIRLVRLDFVEKKVSVLAIPRDFYVTIVDMADHNIIQGRINATYGYGEKFNGTGQGIFSVSRNIEHNFGVTFDRYLVLNFDDIAEYIDLIGGVEITLDKPVVDETSYFRSGLHLMDGETAVTFMRLRKFDTDFARINRQSLVLKAFYKKAMNEISLFDQLQLASKILLDGSIQSDFTIEDISPIICLVNAFEDDAVDFIEIPGEMYHSFTTSSGGAVQIPHDTVAPFIQSVMDGSYQPLDSD